MGRRQRRDLAGLEDHGVAGSQRGGRLPHGDLDGVVPGADAGYHAQRLLARVDEAGRAQRDLAALDGHGQTGVVLDHVGAGDDVHGPGLGQGLAGVAAFQLGQLVVGGAQQFDGAIEDAGPLDRGEGGPGLLAPPGAGHGVVDVGVGGRLDLGQHLARGGVDGLEAFGIGAFGDVTAIDEGGKQRHGNVLKDCSGSGNLSANNSNCRHHAFIVVDLSASCRITPSSSPVGRGLPGCDRPERGSVPDAAGGEGLRVVQWRVCSAAAP